MKRLFSFFAALIFIFFTFNVFAEEDQDSTVESLLSAVIQESYPGCQLVDYAPIARALDSEEKHAVMIVNTEQPAAGVEFRNEKILEGIPLDKGTVQVMDPLTYPQ